MVIVAVFVTGILTAPTMDGVCPAMEYVSWCIFSTVFEAVFANCRISDFVFDYSSLSGGGSQPSYLPRGPCLSGRTRSRITQAVPCTPATRRLELL